MTTRMAVNVLAGLALAVTATLAGAQEHRDLQGIKQALGAAKITLAQAIETAQKEVAGGKVIEAGLEVEKDVAVYEVVVLSGEAVKEVKIDVASGKVLGVKDEKPDKHEEKELTEAKQALGAAKLTFAQAMEAAAKEVKDGKAFKIELEMKDGQSTYDVVLLQGEKVMKIALDAISGKTLKAEEKKPGEHKEDEHKEGEHKHGEHKDGEHKEGEHEGNEVAEAKEALTAAKVSLAQALDAAGKEVKDGKPVGVELEMEDGKPTYGVMLLQGDKLMEAKIDAVSGKAAKVEEEKLDAEEAKELAETKQALGAAKLTFAQALEAAGKEVRDGKAFKIELEMKAGQPSYEVVLLQGDKVMKTALDAASGKVLKTAEWQAKGEKKESGEEDEEEEGAHEGHGTGKAQQAIAAAKITFAQALETAGKEMKGGQVLGIALGLDDGKPVYTLDVLQGEKVTKTRIDAVGGKVLRSEEMKLDKEEADELAESKAALGTVRIPFAQALELAAKEVKDGKVLKAELEMEKGGVTYEVVLLQGDKVKKATLDVTSGKVLKVEEQRGKHEQKEEENENDEEEEHEGHAAKAAPQKESAEGGAFRQEFKVDNANWVSHGTNPYFILEPGYRWRYKHGATVLTITILDETKVVDGVTTRVLEEREEKDGKPLEVSRNYFAIDKSTGDVFYFGEDVDEYKDGKVVGHEGGWLAGANGAKFGLMMPGQAKVGDKFYQEVASKTAMDRAEIVSLNEKINTSAGKYDKCLQVKETTPLEKGVSHKWYAPGVGLVKDDEFVLEAVEKPKR